MAVVEEVRVTLVAGLAGFLKMENGLKMLLWDWSMSGDADSNSAIEPGSFLWLQAGMMNVDSEQLIILPSTINSAGATSC